MDQPVNHVRHLYLNRHTYLLTDYAPVRAVLSAVKAMHSYATQVHRINKFKEIDSKCTNSSIKFTQKSEDYMLIKAEYYTNLWMITDTNVFKKKLNAYFYKQTFCVAYSFYYNASLDFTL